jgi:hypothetical protein
VAFIDNKSPKNYIVNTYMVAPLIIVNECHASLIFFFHTHMLITNIKVSEDNEHGAAALYSQQQAKKFGSY